MSKSLWVEKYRPKTIDGYVFRDAQQRKQVETWIKDQSIPHLLLSGSAGIGKTTMAKILINSLGIEEFDVLEINASRTNSVDDVRNLITNFVSMIPFGPFKVVLLDEADYLSPNAQAALRGVMEEYHSTARFILTCNYMYKIIPAIQSRCQEFNIGKVDQTEFTSRAAVILVEENIDFELDDLDTLVKATYPDLRKCINTVQQHVQDGRLISPSGVTSSSTSDWKIDMVDLFKKKKYKEARNLVCSKARPEEIGEIYRWLYDNLELFSTDEDTKDAAIIIIKQGLIDHPVIADPEINLAATIIKLARIQ